MTAPRIRAPRVLSLGLMIVCCSPAAAQMGSGMGFGEALVPQTTHIERLHITPGGADEPLFSPYETLDYEQRVVSTPRQEPKPGKEEATKEAASAAHDERSVSSQTKFRIRRQRIYPQVDLRHATPTFMAYTVGVSTTFERVLAEALSKNLERPLDYEEKPLGVVLRDIGGLLSCPLTIDYAAMDEADIDVDTAISAKLPAGISLQAALRRLLRPAGLTLTIKNEMLLVTTREAAESDLVVKCYPMPWSDAPEALIGHIMNTVQPPAWDAQGGPGVIRVEPTRHCLWISQTLDIHDEIMDLLQRLEEPFEEQQPGQVNPPVVRSYRLSDEAKQAKLSEQLVLLCNTALGGAADPAARVTMVGNTCFVHSSSRPFHVLAAETIRSVNGVWIETVEREHSLQREPVPRPNSFLGFCWVAREVYGTHDGRWLIFRAWLIDEAPDWLLKAYATHGPEVAAWLHGKPIAKRLVQMLMDTVVGQERTFSAASGPDQPQAANVP